MNKRNLLKIVNILIALLILNQATTALIHDLLPRDVFGFLHKIWRRDTFCRCTDSCISQLGMGKVEYIKIEEKTVR